MECNSGDFNPVESGLGVMMGQNGYMIKGRERSNHMGIYTQCTFRISKLRTVNMVYPGPKGGWNEEEVVSEMGMGP